MNNFIVSQWEVGLYTVGFWRDNKWIPKSDHSDHKEAFAVTIELNMLDPYEKSCLQDSLIDRTYRYK